MKYIIEIEDEPYAVNDFHKPFLYKAKGFNSLVFDMDGLNKLEQFEEDKYDFDNVYDEAYKNGLNDAWNAACKIVNSPITDHLEEIFDITDAVDILPNVSAFEAITKLKSYEEQQDNCIKVGDEVRLINSTGIVTRRYYGDGPHYNVLWSSGKTGFYGESELTRTGRHFPEMIAFLKEMDEKN